MSEHQPTTSFGSLDQIIRMLAQDHADHKILSYPVDGDDYLDITGAELDRLTAKAALGYYKPRIDAIQIKSFDGESNGAGPADAAVAGGVVDGANTVPKTTPSVVVAMLGISTLEYHLTFLGLQRLGVDTMLVSPRIADHGLAHLLRSQNCRIAVASGPSIQTLTRVRENLGLDVEIIPIFDLDTFLHGPDVDPVAKSPSQALTPTATTRQGEPEPPVLSPKLIMHTGGTTGLPKPVPLSISRMHSDIVRSYPTPRSTSSSVSTLPLFHVSGFGTLLYILARGGHLILLRGDRPVTATAIIDALDRTAARHLHTVPYVLKFLAEHEGGIARLAALDDVTVNGAGVPDSLANALIAGGVGLKTGYGQTESGILMAIAGDVKQDGWGWLTPVASAEKFLRFEPIGGGMFHLVVLPGLESKVFSDRPDGSYGTKDIFVPHPERDNWWRFAARHDDMIILQNGENADPHPLEAAVQANPLVQVAIAFGMGRESLGMFVIPSDGAEGMTRDEIREKLGPNLERGNALVFGYAKITPEALVIKEVGTTFPMTDKLTVIRPRFLQQFEKDIDAYYARREQETGGKDMLAEDVGGEEVRHAVREIVVRELKLDTSDGEPLADDTDFFARGMDSLQAVNVRTALHKKIPLGGRLLVTNVAFEYPTVASLTSHLMNVRRGAGEKTNGGNAATAAATAAATGAPTTQLRDRVGGMIEKYTAFPPVQTGSLEPTESGEIVVLTGATGFIGRQILHTLLLNPAVSRVVPLVRAADHDAAARRVTAALADGQLMTDLTPVHNAKLRPLAADLANPTLGLSPDEYASLRDSATAIIHNGWAVNFKMGLASFESQCVAGTSHLLSLAMTSRRRGTARPSFSFMSSVATVLGALPDDKGSTDGTVKEERYGLERVVPAGYGLSKFVAEEMCHAAAEHVWRQSQGTTSLPVRIVRVGQVAGDSKHGRWNPAEAIPAMAQTALTIGALPSWEHTASGEASGDVHHWLPADVCGAAIAELALLQEGDKESDTKPGNAAIFHVAGSHPISWTREVLPVLEREGLVFEKVSPQVWLHRLEDSSPDVRKNPPYKLLDHFKARFDTRSAPGLDDTGSRAGLQLDMEQGRKHAPSLREDKGVDGDLVAKFLKYWRAEAW